MLFRSAVHCHELFDHHRLHQFGLGNSAKLVGSQYTWDHPDGSCRGWGRRCDHGGGDQVVARLCAVLSVAGLTNTGPLVTAATADQLDLVAVSVGAKMIFVLAMVVGRIETLALIALLTPDLWRA